MILEQKLLDFVKSVIFVANTPAFIFNSIKDENSIKLFADTIDAKEIYNELKKIEVKEKKTPDDLATVYLLVVALSYKSDFDVRQLLTLNFGWVDWYKYLVAILSTNVIAMNTTVSFPKYVIKGASYIKSNSASDMHESFSIAKK